MKYLITLLLLTTTASAQDVIWKDASGHIRGAFVYDATSPENRADMVREAFAWLMPLTSAERGDRIVIKGEADFGTVYPLFWPSAHYEVDGADWGHHVEIDGRKNPDGSIIKESGTPGFILSLGATTFSGKGRFWAACHDPNEDAGLFGWNRDGDASVVFNVANIVLDCGTSCEWGIYNWSAGNKSITIDGTPVEKGQERGKAKGSGMLVSAMYSGGNTQAVTIKNLDVWLDANGCQSYGESSSSNPDSGGVLSVCGIRGGTVTLENVNVIEAVGLSKQYDPTGKYGIKRIAALATDTYYKPGQKCEIRISNCRVLKVVPNLSTVWNDYDVRSGVVKVNYAVGSASDGSFKVWGK